MDLNPIILPLVHYNITAFFAAIFSHVDRFCNQRIQRGSDSRRNKSTIGKMNKPEI